MDGLLLSKKIRSILFFYNKSKNNFNVNNFKFKTNTEILYISNNINLLSKFF